uniref:RagB/SusD family nutrient uptake outer membrane protein n=1 Tax=Pedobacter schmidteae TaxID=2201271 RepID=UPI000EB5C906|nr:RagB/SusD family nutrient uptake outer membrane protein [Pedobacter schmidteae]
MKRTTYLLMFLVFFTACKKDWLEKKRDISVIVPTTLKDLRLLLNNELPLNIDGRALMESSCDDIYVTKSQFDAITTIPEHNALVWKKDLYEGASNIKDWDSSYSTIQYANVILDALTKITRNSGNALEYDNIKGNALYFRSRAFFNLVMSFAKYYDKNTASTDLGIPLKLSSDINEKITRASVQEVYEMIISDLQTAGELLPSIAKVNTDASKLAAYGLLSRCFYYMDNYERALEFANKAYAINNYLIDYNTVSPTAGVPTYASGEMHIYSNIVALNLVSGLANIDEEFYNSYSQNDLRKTMYFTIRPDGGIHFQGYYVYGGFFGGTATDEMLLIKSECKARLNDIAGAMEDLNTLLIKRYKTNTYVPLSATSIAGALSIINTERRKELTRRGLRFQDLKKLNRDPATAKTLTKIIDGVSYTLPPNDPRYVFPIPDYVIRYSGITQNQR